MKKLIFTSCILSLFALSAHADATRAEVQDHYKTVTKRVPYTTQVCEDVTVGGDKSGDMLTGAIIGGIIGNNVTKNVDNGGAVGALLGGIIGHNNSKARGSVQTQCRNVTQYNSEVHEVYSHSIITFWQNGKQYRLRFNK